MTTLLEDPTAADESAPADDVPNVPKPIGYLLLALLAYVPPLLTAPGKVAADTKQYLYLDPGRLLSRSIYMWDPNVGMGTVTHQTIGYAFPMGPYYWVLDKIGLPDWVAQRLWLGSLLFVAALGVLYLLRTFGLKGPGVVVAALAFMLTPYVLDYAARISVLLMPWAALPWMLGVTRKALRDARDPDIGRLGRWRYPAIFALIVQIVGGVNATALIFAGIAPVLWILYSWLIAREVRFRQALGVTVRIGFLTLFSSLWWIAGLRMQAAYGLDILKYTETVDAVARTSYPNEVLRGLGYWFFYGQDRLGPWTEASRDYTQHLVVIFSGYLLAALALLGASLLRWKHRFYFVALLFVGVVIAVGANPYAHPSPLGTLFKAVAASSTAALALRSTGRAVPLVVLSLAVFLGLGTTVMANRVRAKKGARWALVVPGLVVVLLLVNFPALYDGTYYGKNLERDEKIPDYWTQAIAALGNDQQTRVLETPGSDFASYRWGNTVDPITPGLTDRPYIARELIPYGTAGTADLLNAIDRRVQEGTADPTGLVALYRRMGIGTVLARNDIQYERYDLVQPRELARLLARTPGLGKPVGYGPKYNWAAPGLQDELTLSAPPNEGLMQPVVLYPVENPEPILRAEANDHQLMVSGDGEGLVDAADVGLVDDAGVIRYSGSYTTPDQVRAATDPNSVLVVTDNNRLRARKWSSVKDNVGFTEQAGEADKPLNHDNGDARLPLFPNQQPSAYTTAVDRGVNRVVATSYGNTITYTPEDRPANAIDGDPNTAWRAAAFGEARGQKIRLDFANPIVTDHAQLTQTLNRGRNRWITQVALTFNGKNRVVENLDDSSRALFGQTVRFARQSFDTLEITITGMSDKRTNLFGGGDSVGFAEIGVQDEGSSTPIHAVEFLQMPTDLTSALGDQVADHPLVLVMRRDSIQPVPPRVQPEMALDRQFTLPGARTFALTGNATVSTDASPADIDGAYEIPDAQHGGLTVGSSPILPGCLHCRADQALDGDPLTAWETPVGEVVGQWADITSPKPITFDHMDMRVLSDARHSVPTKLRIDADGQTREIDMPTILDKTGDNASTLVHLAFPSITTRHLKITLEAIREERAKTFANSVPTSMPVGIAELGIPGLHLPKSPAQLDSGCRSDLVQLDLKPFPVRITGRAVDGDQLMGLTVTPCDPRNAKRVPTITLGAGEHALTTARRGDVGFSIDRLVLASATPADAIALRGGRVTQIGSPATPAPNVAVLKNGRTSMRVRVTGASGPFWMVLGQSKSPGWHAHVVGGSDLGAPQLVDGYANGWRVTPPGGTFEIAVEWTPQKQVFASIWISLLTALACVVIIVLTSLRRRRRGHSQTALAGDAEIGFVRFLTPEVEHGGRYRPIDWVGPIAAGVLGAIAISPQVGVIVAVIVGASVWKPSWRPYLLVIPAALMLGCGVYMIIEQARFHFPPVFEWPTLFPRARTIAGIALMVLVGGVGTEYLRTRFGTSTPDANNDAPDEEGLAREGSESPSSR